MASKKKPKNPIERKREERSLQKAKRNTKRGKQPRTPRRKDWQAYVGADATEIDDIDVLDDLNEVGAFERIMPLDENDRRREVEARLNKAPERDDPDADTPLAAVPHARVIEATGNMARVAMDGRVLLCTVRGTLAAADTGYANVVAVGDHVIVTETGDDSGLIEEVLPRRTVLARPDPSGLPVKQLIAANLDQLLIVAAWRNPHIWFELVDRYLVTAERNGIMPLVCVNKIDLADDEDEINTALAPYRALGYTVVLTSAEQQRGVKTLRLHLHNKVTVIAGLSGVGKSSLLSAVQPGFDLKTGDTNAERGQGRHTTTQAVMLPFGDGYVVDTPGIREFGLAGLAPRDLLAFYPDVLQWATQCKFADCTHTHEPGCAVLPAVQRGDLNNTRFHSYRAIFTSLTG